MKPIPDTATFDVPGYGTYHITTLSTSYDANIALLQSQAWWGDSSAAGKHLPLCPPSCRPNQALVKIAIALPPIAILFNLLPRFDAPKDLS